MSSADPITTFMVTYNAYMAECAASERSYLKCRLSFFLVFFMMLLAIYLVGLMCVMLIKKDRRDHQD